MGTQSVRWAVKVGAELALTAPDRSILAYLAHCRNERTGQCNPSRDTIVADTGWGDRTVRRTIAKLAEAGILDASEEGAVRGLRVDSQSNPLDSQSNPVDSQSNEPGLTVQDVDSQSSALDSQSKPSYIRKEQELEHQENTPKPPAVEVIIFESFDKFWTVWPRKVGKPQAKKAFDKAIKRASSDTIVEAATAYARNPNLPEKQFIPHPTTWLNRDGWGDELPGPRSNGRPTPTQRAVDIARAGQNLIDSRRGLAPVTTLNPKELRP